MRTLVAQRWLRAESLPIFSAITYLSRTRFRGADPKCDETQDLIEALKAGDRSAAITCAKALARHPGLQGFTGVVVPAPRSSAAKPTLRAFAEALVAQGVGTRVVSAVQRIEAVPSSRLRRREGLPGIPQERHEQTLAGNLEGIGADEAILLLDDIATTGATLKAAAATLRRAGHQGVILAATAGWVDPDGHTEWCPVHMHTQRVGSCSCR